MFLNAKQVHSQLSSDIVSCETLLQLLQEERQALAERDLAALDTIIEKKTAALIDLETSAKVRASWVKTFVDNHNLQVHDAKSIWDALIEETAPAMLQTWQKLKELQQKCKQENEVNGKIIARNQKTFARLLEIMRGQTAAPNLYSSSGKSTGGGLSNIVGEA